MTPLFDKDCNLAGWMQPGEHIFDTDMNWVAFIDEDQVWSVDTGSWLGTVYGLNIRDTDGKTIAWNPEQPIENTLKPLRPLRPLKPLRPLRPLRPLTPLRPLRPLTPLGGWSQLAWEEFLNQ